MNTEKGDNEHFEHIVHKPYILEVIRQLGQGHYPKQIADTLDKHSVEITRTIQQLEKEGVITCKNPGGRPKFYTVDNSFKQFLTRCGKHTNHPTTAESSRVHNVALRFPVLTGRKTRIGRNNNSKPPKQYLRNFHGCTVEKTTKSLIFYCNSVKRGDPFKAYNESIQDINLAVYKFLERFPDITLGKGIMSRKPHIATNINDPLGKAIQEVMEFSNEKGKIDDSEGQGGEIDFFSPNAADAYLKLPGRVVDIEKHIKQIAGALDTFAVAMEQHNGLILDIRGVAAAQVNANTETHELIRTTRELIEELSSPPKRAINNIKKMGRKRMWPERKCKGSNAGK